MKSRAYPVHSQGLEKPCFRQAGRLTRKIEALERYCRSLEKANGIMAGGEVLYMDKEKARLIEELLNVNFGTG